MTNDEILSAFSQQKLKGCDMGQLMNEWLGEYAFAGEIFDQICHEGYHLKGKQITKV